MSSLVAPSVADAERLLLATADLDRPQLDRVLASIHTHDVDFADLYFQHSRFESWSLEEGIVKSGSFSIDRGVGVRAVTGERQAFAYSDDVSARALDEAAVAVRAIGRQGASAVAPLVAASRRARALRARRPGRQPAGGGEGGAAPPARAVRARDGPAGRAGHGVAGGRARDRAGGAQRRPRGGRRAAAGARVDHRDRRGARPARAGPRGRRRALRLRLLRGRRPALVREEGGRPGAAQPRGAAGAGGHDDRRARPRLAGHPAARGHRARARGRLQPQGHERVRRPRRPARRSARRHRRRRRHDRAPPRLAQPRRRGQRRRSGPC